ncbi:thiamine pyrophosphokinase [Ampelomyces quisqualis]|uniref:Thiamine pyrophosphokinase n=1 Tax=Ampelomyces quisqualis TaxID=50730 RepID=A0A6A5QBN9_AMPQU|nr:thiamine pyrophosphokinase [Ampelomyces quisqualis]
MDSSNTVILSPAKFLAKDVDLENVASSADLLILNQPIAHFDAFARLWRHSGYRICADGGANRLFDMFQGELATQRESYLPNVIHGDLDSLRDDVRAYYASHGVEVSQDHDQCSTDFGKTMHKISSRTMAATQKDVLVLGTLAGRVDQGLGLLHEMIREEGKHSRLRIWLFSESSLSFILKRGHNMVQGLRSSRLFTENIGLVPVWGPSIITTKGLEWDVNDWHTHMGGQVSTSNHVKAEEVHVTTDAPILFTIERAPLQG